MPNEALLQSISQAAALRVRVFNAYLQGIEELPPQIGDLVHVELMNLRGNRLTCLPPEIAKLGNLRTLLLRDNQLCSLPAEFGQLHNLEVLDLAGNRLSELPIEIGQLNNLRDLVLDENPLTCPPREILAQGPQAVLLYLRELTRSSRQWVSKLIIVGQGGVGKTELLSALRGEAFQSDTKTTRGIEVRPVELPHPTEPGLTMRLNAWDFGGQEIYHATHQFFLTDRSLFLLVWNSRHEHQQGRLYYWLDTIQARAPTSPILIVGTWLDERNCDIPLSELKHKYPQVVGHWKVSNKTRQNIDDLRQAVIGVAARLPLMGEKWPTSWLRAAEAIRLCPEKHMTPAQLDRLMAARGVAKDKRPVLTQWLHELGDILYFREDMELNDTVILNPTWISTEIGKVLDSDDVRKNRGIFSRSHMDEVWSDLNPWMRGLLLRLMEKFDLSYRTLENRDLSLVVELLPLEPPMYEAEWDSAANRRENTEIQMRFLLNTLPPGIPTWFIARSHRFSTGIHWRTGAVLADGPDRKHLALVQAFDHEHYAQLTVRGPAPQNFFALLRDGLELTLQRYPGLKIRRMVPCPGHGGKACIHEFDHDQLLKRLEKKLSDVECPEGIEYIKIVTLLFGIQEDTIHHVLAELRKHDKLSREQTGAMLARANELVALLQREFTNTYRREQAFSETHCPNVFVLRPVASTVPESLAALAGIKLRLQLCCQAPGRWHLLDEADYTFKEPQVWLEAMAPYVRRLVSVLKYLVPAAGPLMAAEMPQYEKLLSHDIQLMTALVGLLPSVTPSASGHEAQTVGISDDIQLTSGAPLRTLRKLLDRLDPNNIWGHLEKVVTPEGHCLWLCPEHIREYRG